MFRLIATYLLLGTLFLVGPRAGFGQSKTLRIRGQSVELEVHPELLLVKPVASKENLTNAYFSALSKKLIVNQAKLGGVNPERFLNEFTTGKTSFIPMPRLGAVMVPKVKSDKPIPLAELVRIQEEIKAASPVFQIIPKVNGEGKVVPQILVPRGTFSARFKETPAKELLATLEQELKIQVLEIPRYAKHVVRFKGKTGDLDPFHASELLNNTGKVVWAQPDFIMEIFRLGDDPNDTFFSKQWYLNSLEITKAWKSAHKANPNLGKILVAVLDDGVDPDHEDLQGRLETGFDYFEQGGNARPSAKDAHGTACSGIIAALTGNKLGVAGICPTAHILPVRISGNQGKFVDENDVAKAFSFARGAGAKIINCSWGGYFPSNPIFDAIDNATDNGCLVVASAGNARPSMDTFYPARFERCLAVGAITRDDKLWDYSCYGPKNHISLVAPSGDVNLKGDIWTTDHSGANGYNDGKSLKLEPDMSGHYTARFGGTSAAAPMVSGVAALVWATYPKLTATQVRECLESSALVVDKPFGGWVNNRSKMYGFGKVNPQGALAYAGKLAAAVKPVAPAAPDPLSVSSDEPKKEPPVSLKLHETLNPKSEFFYVRGEKVVFQPDTKYVSVKISDGKITADSKFWNLVSAKKTGQQNPGTPFGKTGKFDICIVPVDTLNPMGQLEEAAQLKILPEFYSVYQNRGETVVLTGTVSVRLKTESQIKELLRFAEKNGLKIVRQLDHVFTLDLSANSSFTSPFEAARQLSNQDFAVWAQPDLLRKLNR